MELNRLASLMLLANPCSSKIYLMPSFSILSFININFIDFLQSYTVTKHASFFYYIGLFNSDIIVSDKNCINYLNFLNFIWIPRISKGTQESSKIHHEEQYCFLLFLYTVRNSQSVSNQVSLE